MYAIDTIKFQPASLFTEEIGTTPNKESSITALARDVIKAKEANVEKAKESRWDFSNPMAIVSNLTLIGGDLFSMAYLIFQGVTTCAHLSLPMVVIATAVCGVVAGVINIGVSFVSLKEAIQAFNNGDYKLGLRLLLDFGGFFGIGVIMILAPLAVKFAVLGCISAFFAANPWVLPLLFFVVTIPLLMEIGSRIKNIYLKQDLASDLKLDTLSNLLKKDIVNWSQISSFYGEKNPFHSKVNGAEDLIERMETLQAEMGVTAAIEASKLFAFLLEENKEEAIKQCEKLQEKITEWNDKQHMRLLQQFLFIVAFIVSMGALRFPASAVLYNSIVDFFMAGANAIPLWMDTFWLFERNTPLVVPKVELDDVLTI